MVLVFGASLGGCIYSRKPDTSMAKETAVTETTTVVADDTAAKEAAAKEAAASLQSKANEMKGSLHFAVGSAQLSPEAQTQVAEFGKMAAQSPDQRFILGGFSDNTGSEKQNMTLSQNRAKAVSDILVANGVKADQITLAPKGDQSPIASNGTSAGRAENRRVEVTVAG